MKDRETGTSKPVTRRLFFAFWPDDSVRTLIAHGTRKAVRGSGGRPVPVENLHSTIVFLGAVPEDHLDRVAAVAQTLKSGPVPLRFDRLEHWVKPAVLSLTSSQPLAAATDLATALARLLLAQGFTPDPKPYRPHITIARKVVKPHELGPTHPIEWPAEGIALVESVTAPEGPRYTVLRRWPL
jgi:RNA 2',3'-cyclic 3'-phosphodiesterase